MKKTTILFLTMTAFANINCKKHGDINPFDPFKKSAKFEYSGDPALIELYTNFFVNDHTERGIVSFASEIPLGYHDNSAAHYSITGAIYANPTNPSNGNSCGGNLVINNTSIECNETYYSSQNTDIKNLFGTKVKIHFTDQGFPSPTDSFYIPKEIFADLIPNTDSSFSFKKTDNITMNWIPDVNNTKGVVIMYYYNKTLTKVTGTNSEPTEVNDEAPMKYIVTQDDGNFQFNSSHFEDIPVNSVVSVSLMRWNFAHMATSDGIDYGISAHSENGTIITIIP